MLFTAQLVQLLALLAGAAAGAATGGVTGLAWGMAGAAVATLAWMAPVAWRTRPAERSAAEPAPAFGGLS